MINAVRLYWQALAALQVLVKWSSHADALLKDLLGPVKHEDLMVLFYLCRQTLHVVLQLLMRD